MTNSGHNKPSSVTRTLPEVLLELERVSAELLRVQTLLKFKEEQLRLIHLQKWGPKADNLSPDQLTLLPGEIIVAGPEVVKEAGLPDKQLPKPKAARPNHPGRMVLPASLERREVILPCDPKDRVCPKCGKERPFLGYDTREELDCKPVEYFVLVIKREKRGSHCESEQGVVTAAAPAQIVPKGKLSNAFIIEIISAKFQQHTPVYRQCALLLEEHGIELSRQTSNEALLASGALLVPVVAAQAAGLLAGGYIQADETTMPCQTREKPGKNHPAYLWEYSSPGGPVVFQFEMSRGREGPARFLKNYRGVLQCDGYGAYKDLGEGVTFVACMAHIRRKFVEAGKLSPLDPLPVEIVGRIGLLYQVEQEARTGNLSPEARLGLRRERSQPVMTALKTRIVQIRAGVTPASSLAKACDYALGQWERMEGYLRNGRVEIDNNWCEGAMRPVALGRKNWLHVGDAKAGPKIAALISIVETCRRLDIPLREYLRDVLPKIGGWSSTHVADLTPASWKASRQSPTPPVA